MKTATISELKHELNTHSKESLIKLCLRLGKFKKENKELLTYLLYESSNEAAFIEAVKSEMDQEFLNINTNSYHYIKKSVRKILRNIKKYCRYSQKKETEIDLLIYFCRELKLLEPSYKNNVSLINIYSKQLQLIKKCIKSLHEDLQFDYGKELEKLTAKD